MDGTTSDRKQYVENTVMHRQTVQLSESGGDMITFCDANIKDDN